MEIGGFSPNSNFIVSQGFITEIALATPKELLTAAYEMQHDASTVPLDRITMGLGGTAAPLKSINSIEMNIYNMYVTQTVLNPMDAIASSSSSEKTSMNGSKP
ncbi:hypothetical protein BLOT_014413 [Blomia tropicalis]|nr:hypothetical protein BLOT_014413 [Blomia tropicalis]